MTTALFPAEFVFPGHPDKLADTVADALVQAATSLHHRALAGVEVAVHCNRVHVTGRIACPGAESIDVPALVRDVYRSAGYDESWQPAPESLFVDPSLCLGPFEEGEDAFRKVSDDQAICVGYAGPWEATNHLPVEHWLVGRLARRLHALRHQSPHLQLGPDGKVVLTLAERHQGGSTSFHVDSFSCSLQQRADADAIGLHRAVRIAAAEELAACAAEFPVLSPQLPDSLTVNGAGAFEVGGPEGDNGLSGKKLVVDAYGPRVPIGGGAWSGKDFFKADRAGGLHARRLAKALVRLGIAREATVHLGWFPGDRNARVLRATGEAGQLLDVAAFARAFDLSLTRSGNAYAERDLVELARWGHFSSPAHAWERVERL